MRGTQLQPIPDALPWHTEQWEKIVNAMQSGRLGHALLLSGIRGVGKRMFVQRLVAKLLCQGDAGPCRICSSCRQVAAKGHPAFTGLSLPEKKRDIPVDAVRDMCAGLAMTSHDGGTKVAVVDPVNALNHNGFNALLKTLEEPPTGSLLILISESPLGLPATVRSRCQMLRFPAPPAAEAELWLAKEAPESDEESRRTAMALANGAPLRAMEVLAQPGTVAMVKGWQDMMYKLVDGRRDPLDAVSAVDADHAVTFLEWLAGWTCGCLRKSPAGPLNGYGLARVGQAAVDGTRAIKSNAKPQLVVEALLIEVSRIAAGRQDYLWQTFPSVGGNR